MLRMIVDTFEAALVVAVHDRYRVEPAHRYDDLTEGRIEHHLAVPHLSEPAELGRLITARAQFLDPHATYADLIDESGLPELLTLHAGDHGRSLRCSLAVLKAAFSLAGSDEVEHQQATATHIRAADAGYE